MTQSLTIDAFAESWPIETPFRTARGASAEARIVVATISNGEFTGRGEAAPISRYQQTVESVLSQINSIKHAPNLDRQTLQDLLPEGAARNALDCAFWDLEAKTSGKRIWELANLEIAPQIVTSLTISLNTPSVMADVAKKNADAPILKLKLGGDSSDFDRVEAVHRFAPRARLFIDANESWSPVFYSTIVPKLTTLGVELIEQPFPAGADDALATLEHPIPVCADESCHTSTDLSRLANRYQMINVKLDKTGGLTEAIHLVSAARQSGLKLLFGCMVGTSLGMAPARILVGASDFADLDGPLLLAQDRPNGLSYRNGKIGLPDRELWG